MRINEQLAAVYTKIRESKDNVIKMPDINREVKVDPESISITIKNENSIMVNFPLIFEFTPDTNVQSKIERGNSQEPLK